MAHSTRAQMRDPAIGTVRPSNGIPTVNGGDRGFAINPQFDRPISLSWLKSKKNWPDHAEQKLQEFMTTNNYWHYKSTRSDSCQQMDRIIDELRPLFESQGWDERIHAEKLKDKVSNKIHRIRAKRDILTELRTVLEKVPNELHGDARNLVSEVLGQEPVIAGLDELNWFDYSGASQAEGS